MFLRVFKVNDYIRFYEVELENRYKNLDQKKIKKIKVLKFYAR